LALDAPAQRPGVDESEPTVYPALRRRADQIDVDEIVVCVGVPCK
jgi:hypothetical protein